MTGQRREVREEVTQPNTLNEKNKYKYKYKQRIIMKVFEMPSYDGREIYRSAPLNTCVQDLKQMRETSLDFGPICSKL